MSQHLRTALVLTPLFAALMGTASGTAAGAGAKGKVKYIYIVSNVAAAKGVSSVPVAQVRSGLLSGIDGVDALVRAMPEGAPDHAVAPEKFKSFLKKKRLRAFRVNLEIIRYEQTEEGVDDKGHKRVGTHINVRLFGETIPDRVMAFAGSGSATVKLDVGKNVRAADRDAATKEAIVVAINEALNESLSKLNAPDKSKKRRRGKK